MGKKILGLLVVGAIVIIGAVLYKNNAATLPAPTPESAASARTDTSGGAETPSADVSPSTEKIFTIIGTDYSFAPAKITVKKGDSVKIIFKDDDGFHNLSIEGYKIETKRIRTGAEDSIDFVADKTGTFEYYCDVGSHRALGMHGMLVVE